MQLLRPQFVATHPPTHAPPASPAGATIAGLVREVAPIRSDTTVQLVADRFADDPALGAVPVVDDGVPVGLVTRTKLSRRLFARFGMALFERRPIRVLLDGEPLVVSATAPVVEILERAITRPTDDVYDDVIAVDASGRYVGVAQIQRLVLEQGHVLARTAAERELADERAKELETIAGMKSQFLAHVTHELRAPVNTLVGLADLVEAALASDDRERMTRYVALITRSSSSLRHLVNNVLDLAKIESGRMVPSPGRFSVDELASEVVESLRVLARGKPVEVRVEVATPHATLVSDPVMLRHVLTNLGTNAVKFTEQGGVTLRVIGVPDGARIDVSDTGIGMKAEDVGRIFEPFAQVADVATRRHDGTGLGLAITKHLVGLLGGRVDVSSALGKGSTFSVFLPNFIEKEPPS